MVYYNENNKKKVQTLLQLIKAGAIAEGHVDDRSIVDVRASDLVGYTQCHFFAGAGIWSHALRLAGWEDDRPIWTASCPCQPFSPAGLRKGTEDERHLFPELARIMRSARPELVVGEQVQNGGGLPWIDDVRIEVEAQGNAFGVFGSPACSVGAPHIRPRLYWVSIKLANGNGKFWGLPNRQGRIQDPKIGWRSAVVTVDDAMRIGREEIRDDHGEHDRQQPAPTITVSALGEPASERLNGRTATGKTGRTAAERDSGDGSMGDAESGNQRRVSMPGLHGPGFKTGGSSDTRGLGIASGEGLSNSEPETIQRSRRRKEGRATEQSSGSLSALADGELQPGCPEHVEESRGWEAAEPDHTADRPGPVNGFWRSSAWIPCSDGKFRPVEAWAEPGSREIPDGLAADLGLVRYGSVITTFPLIQKTKKRAQRLKEYGDGIVAPHAAAFIRAVKSVLMESPC